MENNNKDLDMPLSHHLEALRECIIKSLVAICALTPLGFYIAPKVIDFLIHNSMPLDSIKLHYFSPMEVFIIQLKAGVVLAVIFSFPYLIYRIRKFILPALYKNERKFLFWLIFLSTFLFISGAAFCVFVILPLIMNFSLGFMTDNLEATLGLNNFISLSSGLILAFGVMFQFPLFVISLVKFNLVDIKTIINLRPYIIVFILILAAIFTPPDIISQLMLFVPTWLLFEAGLIGAKLIGAKLFNKKD